MHLTRQSRQVINNFCLAQNFHYLMIEFKCNEQSLTENIADTVEFYKNLDSNTDWFKVFKGKMDSYLPKYQSCSPSEGPLICVNNSEDAVHHSVTAKGVLGALQTSILGVLAAPVMRKQVFYFSRHGESEYNVLGRIGGNADLSPRGQKYGERLTRHFGKAGTVANPKPRLIWTSELQRTIHTVQHIPGVKTSLKDLNEINAGICEGLTYEEIQERFPQEFAWRDQDKLKYRYPHGESYLDLLKRVDGVVQALLTKTDVLVVSHQAVLRTIMAYFLGSSHEEIPYINVPLHSLLIVRSFGYDYKVEIVPLQVECVDTYRVQPTNCSIKRTADDALTTVPAHFDKIHQIPQQIS
jgi:6-phosphofructo-2-kinase / fructose-2,6-biphosphatase 3